MARAVAWMSALLLVASGRADAVAPEAFAIDPSASRVRLHLGRTGMFKFLGHEHEIDAPIAAGVVEVTEGDPARSSVRLRFDSGRLAVVPGTEPAGDIPTVEERMRGPEVLEVARYPEIGFTSSSVTAEARGPGQYRLVVKGVLVVKGRSWPVEVPLEVTRHGTGIEARGEAQLGLRDLGIEPPSVAGVVKVANRFRLAFEIRAQMRTPPEPSQPPDRP